MKSKEPIIKLLRELLDWLFPRNYELERLENFSPGELRDAAGSKLFYQDKNISALFDYRQPLITTAIWELKYRGNKRIAKLLAETLHSELLEDLADRLMFENFQSPLLLPIPLSNRRRRKRGFNQCELLAEELAKIDGSQSFTYQKNILLKIKHTESQTKSHNKRERLENLKDCFSVKNPETVRGQNIILLDDVFTTGATLNEARRTLLLSGAKKVIAYAIAH